MGLFSIEFSAYIPKLVFYLRLIVEIVKKIL